MACSYAVVAIFSAVVGVGDHDEYGFCGDGGDDDSTRTRLDCDEQVPRFDDDDYGGGGDVGDDCVCDIVAVAA